MQVYELVESVPLAGLVPRSERIRILGRQTQRLQVPLQTEDPLSLRGTLVSRRQGFTFRLSPWPYGTIYVSACGKARLGVRT